MTLFFYEPFLMPILTNEEHPKFLLHATSSFKARVHLQIISLYMVYVLHPFFWQFLQLRFGSEITEIAVLGC